MKNTKKIILIFISIILITIILICSNLLIKQINVRIEDNKKASIESEIQLVIDEVKQEKELENVNSVGLDNEVVTIENLKDKFAELGYNLDTSTGKMIYNNYIVTISNDLVILDIEEITTQAYFRVYEKEDNTLKGLLTIENINGIEKVSIGEIQYYCNNKQKVAFDSDIVNDGLFEIKIKAKNEEEKLYKIEPAKEIVVTNYDSRGDGTTRTISINYSQTENITNSYSIDGEKTWKQYEGEFDIKIADVEKISLKSIWNDVGTIRIENNYDYTSASLLDVTKYSIYETGYYEFTINGEKYPIHAYVYDQDLTITSDMSFGDENDIGTASGYAKNTIVLKVNGNLTIDSDATLTAYGSAYGGPKGMLIYVDGVLTNNGSITMTARGAKATGQNVYLWKNAEELYEYVPANGASGGASTAISYNSNIVYNGNKGGQGTLRTTGGGGSGATSGGGSIRSGAGSRGTSYSGGSGSGGACGRNSAAASYNGGNGVSFNSSSWTGGAGGGAGNPAGSNAVSGTPAKNGTGGLLVIYGKSVNNNNLISSNGSSGGSSYRSGGGGSGGR